MSENHLQFLGLEGEATVYETASAVLLPLPFEHTTSYGQGTRRGPEALLRASHYVELYDEELDAEPCDGGIHTLPAWDPKPGSPAARDMAAALDEIEKVARQPLADGKFLATIGGEHSLTQAPVRAARDVFDEIGVVQFDAHADLRDEYEGTPLSHACVMRRLVEDGFPTLGVGLRALSQEEGKLIQERRLPVVWGHQLDAAEEAFTAGLERLPERVYLTFDVDFFDPSLFPATGTPEPGGGFWTPTLRLLQKLFESKDVVAMDVVELAPIDGLPASDFIAAKLLYKCLGYHWDAGRRRAGRRRAGSD